MTRAFQCFNAIMQDTQNIDTLYNYLHNYVVPPYDYSDLLRWQWVQSVSALDKLVHDLIRIGMSESFSGNRPITDKFSAFTLDYSTYQLLQNNPLGSSLIFEQYITIKHKALSFQEPSKISEGLSLIWPETHKWQAIAAQMGRNEHDVRTEMKNIAIRRNQIVHEGDYASPNLARQTIDQSDSAEVIRFILEVGTAIYTLVR